MKIAAKYSVLVLILFLTAYFLTYDRRVVSGILNADIPFMSRVIDCKSWGFTDVLTECAVHIDPQDFQTLLEGRNFMRYEVSGSSFDLASGPSVGPEFQVAQGYIAHPPEFPHGGHVIVLTNLERNKANVQIYVE